MIVAQISDPHISDAPSEAAVSASTRLQQAVAHLLRLPVAPDVVVVTGDCANTGSASEYERFQALLRPLPMPVYVVPGNHDNRAQLLAAFGVQGTSPLSGFVQYVVDDGPVRLLALDTHVPGRDAGALGAEQLEWLQAQLARSPERPTVIFMHHPPIQTGLAIPDGIGLVDADAFGAIIARHPQVERILAGHLHMAVQRRFHGTVVQVCPSTAHALLPDMSQPGRLAVVMEPPTCLLHVWNARAGLLTYTSAIGDHGPAVLLHDGERWLPTA